MGCCTNDTVQVVQYDTRPSLQLSVYDALSNALFDLSNGGTQVYFVIRPKGAGNAKEAILCQKLPGIVNPDGSVSIPPAYTVAGSGGRVEVHWTATALDTPGAFEGELQVYWNDGTRQTTPDTVPISIKPAWGGLPMAPEPLP